MKVTKTVMIGALSLAALGSFANAATVVRLCGSTAFRAVVHQALLASVFDSAPNYGYAGTSGVSGANCSEFSGNISSSPFLIKTYWSGSEGGIQAVDQDSTGLALFFVDPTNNGLPTVGGVATALTSGGTANLDDSTSSANQTAHPTFFEHAIPDGDFSDTFQGASQFNTLGTQSYQGHKYPALTAVSGGSITSGGIIGVIPFEFVASHTSTITNITSQVFRALEAEGSLSRSQFPGQLVSDTTTVTPIGRDADSGTRVTALSETGYGGQNAVIQSYPYNLSQTTTPIAVYGATVTSVSEVPASTVDGVPLVAGNGGYSSGGNLSKAMTATTAGFGDFIAYLGASDAAAAQNTGNSSTPAIGLQYNGVTPSLSALENGQYTFWGYEHVYYRAGSSVASTINTVAQDIAAQATGSVPTGGVLPINVSVSNMNVARGSDGGTVE
jgi:hypothetical protein